MALAFAWWTTLAISAGVLLSLWYYIARDALLRLPRSVVRCELDMKQRIVIATRSGASLKARLRAGSFVTPRLTLLRYQLDGHRSARHVVILPDMLHAEDFRRLRVLLKWSRYRASEPEPTG